MPERDLPADALPTFQVAQPIVSLTDSKHSPVGVEILSRWDDCTPEEAFERARTNGQEVGLDIACIRRGLDSLDRVPEHLYVSLNVTSATFVDSRLIKLLRDLASPRRIVLEVSEESELDELQALRPQTFLHLLGVRVAVDDVGRKFADMRRIVQLKPDVIKLDRSLVSFVDRLFENRILIRGYLAVAAELGAEVVAEGVEREAEHAYLVELGVRYGQGWLYGEGERL